jgi:NADPH-dependent 2,4-dienoyl-CoA reductase/sulfur reductase-like enzyme
MKRIVIVGASLAGLRAAEKLRADGYVGYLALVGAEQRLPYDRPPLSKQVLTGMAEAGSVQLRDEASYAELDVDMLLGRLAIELDVAARKVSLDNGEVLGFDGLLIATGSTPRLLPGVTGRAGVHTLRTLEDALAIRDAMGAGARVVVVGAGFIGAEVAAAARSRGLDVTVAEPLAVPLARALGVRMGERAAALLRDHGVDLRCGVGVAGIDGAARVERVRLTDGTMLPADLVVVGVGARPATDWLKSSGLPLDDGLLCDQTCAVAGADGIYAAGDVARWEHPLSGASTRVEHWTNAVEQGNAAAANMLRGRASAEPFGPVPYFWSDQFGTKIQFVGTSTGADEVRIVSGAPDGYRFAACYGRHGRVVGCLGFSQPKAVIRARRMIAEGASVTDAVGALS